MQQCPFCDKVYDESEYSYCPFVHVLNAVVAYIGMEKFGNAQTVTTQRKTKKGKRLSITGNYPVVRSLLRI